jgi:hypothetical protein
MENEVWIDIKGYEGQYQISNLGRVKSLEREVLRPLNSYTIPTKILKHGKNKKGYEYVNLCKYSKVKLNVIHRLVAIHFIPNTENKATVNHKNGIKIDNRVENLEWNTVSENTKHAHKNGLSNISELNRQMSRDRLYKKVIHTETNKIFNSVQSAAEFFKINKQNLSSKLNGKKKNNTGLIFYEENNSNLNYK